MGALYIVSPGANKQVKSVVQRLVRVWSPNLSDIGRIQQQTTSVPVPSACICLFK